MTRRRPVSSRPAASTWRSKARAEGSSGESSSMQREGGSGGPWSSGWPTSGASASRRRTASWAKTHNSLAVGSRSAFAEARPKSAPMSSGRKAASAATSATRRISRVSGEARCECPASLQASLQGTSAAGRTAQSSEAPAKARKGASVAAENWREAAARSSAGGAPSPGGGADRAASRRRTMASWPSSVPSASDVARAPIRRPRSCALPPCRWRAARGRRWPCGRTRARSAAPRRSWWR